MATSAQTPGRRPMSERSSKPRTPSILVSEDVLKEVLPSQVIRVTNPKQASPAAAIVRSSPTQSVQPQATGGDGVRAIVRVSTTAASPDPIIRLRELQAQRLSVVRSQRSLVLQSQALTRRVLGWQAGADEDDREKINAKAQEIVEAIEGGKEIAPECLKAALVVSENVLIWAAARDPIDKRRKEIESQMRDAAGSLRVWPFVEKIRGFAALGLAIIVGEAGDIGTYANPGKLWKRFGVAPLDGKAASTWRSKGGLSSEQWETFGYCPRRRSALFTIGDSLIKCNNSDYRKIYDERKAYEAARNPEMTKLHAHRRAQRYMEKRLLLDLWKAWRAAP